MFWDPLMRHLWKSKIWRCQWKLAVWILILIAYRKRATHQSLARETGNMRHREKLRTVPDVSEQMLELFFAKLRHGELVSKSRRLHLGRTGRAPKMPPEHGFTKWCSLFVGMRFTSRSNGPAGGLPLTPALPRSSFPLLEPGLGPGPVGPCPGCLGFSLRTPKCTFLPFCDHLYKHLEAHDRHLLPGNLGSINNILQSTITGVGNVCGWSISLLENAYSSEQEFSSRELLLLTNFSME